MKQLLKIIAFLVLVAMHIGCTDKSEIDRQLMEAERLMEVAPDSSLRIIEGINADDLLAVERKARYALLKSMALDKNYIDTTTFDVLQPAIDYYLVKGGPDERLRTRYYQGRIYQNRGDLDEAINAFMYAMALPGVTDSLTMARICIAEAVIYYETYNELAFTESALKAAEIYGNLKDRDRELDALTRAMNGCVLLKNKNRADSVACEIDRVVGSNEVCRDAVWPCKVNYITTFGSDADIRALLDEVQGCEDMSDLMKLNVAECYLKLGESDKALACLESVTDADGSVNPLGYMATEIAILAANGKYKEAFGVQKEFYELIETNAYGTYVQNQHLTLLRHEMELSAVKNAMATQRMVLIGLCAVLLLLIVCGVLYYRGRLAHSRRVIAENDRANAEVKLEKQRLEAENLGLRVAQLEEEKATLGALLQTRQELSEPIERAIKERVELLNAIVAKDISTNAAYAKPYDQWIERVAKDRTRFMDSTRLAFKASHPKFMEYLENKGLSVSEINYLCLYAIGLRGKEVGEYLQLKRHYNISSEIRHKLGLDEHETNIGIYVRRLMKSV